MNAKRTRNYYDMFAIMFNSQKSYRKYIENTYLGLLTETHEGLGYNPLPIKSTTKKIHYQENPLPRKSTTKKIHYQQNPLLTKSKIHDFRKYTSDVRKSKSTFTIDQ